MVAAIAPRGRTPVGTPRRTSAGAGNQAATLDGTACRPAGFDGCALRDTASNLVFAEGDPASTTLIIGEPPGREEDRSGHPFAGPEGQLLDQMLASIGLTRAESCRRRCCHGARPAAGRRHRPKSRMLLPFLHRLIALLRPQRIVLLGGTAGRVLLPQAGNRRRIPRGWAELSIPGMPHSPPSLALPGLAEMLKTPPLRRDAWAGLRLLRRAIDLAQTQT